jgi:DNA-binding transcriptional MerR regulator
MEFRDLCKQFNVEEPKIRYWDKMLKKHELISPKDTGTGHDYSEKDLKQFRTLESFLNNGAKTVTEAIRLMKNNISPEEAYRQYQQAQSQIAVLQKKVLQLRRPLWTRFFAWLKGLVIVLLPRKAER